MTTQHNFDPKRFFITGENFNRRDLACMFFVEKSQLAVEERKPITFFFPPELFWRGMKLLTVSFTYPYPLLGFRSTKRHPM